MLSYIGKRILSLIPVLFVVSFVVFLVVYMIPGGPATAILGLEASADQINALNAQLGFDRPFLVQYGDWIVNVFQGGYLLSMFLMLFLSVYHHWFPVAGYAPLANGLLEHWKYLFVPALSLGIVQAAYITRMTRSSLLEVLYKNYIRTARAKGLKERKVVLRYALKNAAPAILTAVGQSFGSLITGTIVTETLFNIPGLGMLTMGSINRRDVYVIQGVVLFVTLLYVLVNLVVDILYGFVDPRLQPGRNK